MKMTIISSLKPKLSQKRMHHRKIRINSRNSQICLVMKRRKKRIVIWNKAMIKTRILRRILSL